MNIFIGMSILVTSIGLLAITYNVHCNRINSIYCDQVEQAAMFASKYAFAECIIILKENMETEGFRAARERAVAENDPGIIEDWMKSREGTLSQLTNDYTLYDDYMFSYDMIVEAQSVFPLAAIYYQYDKDGITYNLVKPDEDLLYVGSTEPYLEAFAGYYNNDHIPATIYNSVYGWLCTACEPLVDTETGEVFAFVGVDIDMNDVVREQQWFLYNSIIFIVVLTMASILISMLFVRFIAVKPLRLLQRGTSDFTGRNNDENAPDGYTMSDVMDLNIRNNDEIGDLYHEIRDMQINIVQNTEALTTITAEKEHIKTELDLAARIQYSALPIITPGLSARNEFTLGAFMTTAKEVGGDFYDFFPLDDDRLALVIADVSGKGIPAALFMMTAKVMISSRAQAGGTPAEILSDVNVRLCENNPTKMFVTVWLGILDLKTGVLTACNAGHEEPVLRRENGSFEYIHDKHGLVLGGLKRSKYTDYEIAMNPGDVLFVFTDGIPEAVDRDRQFYGFERMLGTLNSAGSTEPDLLIDTMKKSVDEFTGDAEQFDDLTMLCIRYNGQR